MNIAICDDTFSDLTAIQELVLAYGEQRDLSIQCSSFSSGTAFLESVRSGAHYDIVFMDILMPGLSGMESARELRALDEVMRLVFITVSPSFAVEAFSVKARHYLVKPITDTAVFVLLEEVSAELAQDMGGTMLIKTKHGVRKLRASWLEYCEMLLRTIRYHMTNGVTVEGEGNMKELEAQLLAFPMFLRPHRSFLVNMDFITDVSGKRLTITLDSGVQIPIPKAKYAEVRDAYASYLQPSAEEGAHK